jgi:hypothetical protein
LCGFSQFSVGIFLVVTRAVSVPGLSRREAWWKDTEIL